MKNELAVIVLAAGKGTRMKSELPKVLHPVAGTPMLHHVLGAVERLEPARTLVVVGFGADKVEAATRGAFPAVEYVLQKQQNGTGSAVLACEAALKDFKGNVLVVYGDVMLNSCPHTLPALVEASAKNAKGLTLLAADVADPTGFGRLFKKGGAWVNVEEKDCTPAQRKTTTANPGIYTLPAAALWPLLRQLKPNNKQGELYLTDIIELAAKAKLKVNVVPVEATRELMGINTRQELANMEMEVQDQLRSMHMENGVTLLDPYTVYFAMDTDIANDVVIEPNVVFGPKVIVDSNVLIRAFSHVEGAHIGKGSTVGPFARLRPGAELAGGVHIGNFVEIKNSTVGAGSKVNHLSYIGDTTMGADVNVGAGSITANYNKKTGKKSKTIIGDGASLGSHTTLVAPVTMGKNAVTGAGTVVRESIEPGALAVAKPHVLVKKNYNK
ncbi:MAG TPA: bifunctional UDP-N-acetylglucosamine diphosphorylase/glucosamine-1-phosphate N-acetyltransferase GlmU [Alphaproteobacteria bacterium]|nr:bifunctional UDP-N-acetylglucosamine diphosphorylase/glucosamine-1-phosphate N-acetyltransferase GlmU [Alphaproteobacteria bacterium]